MTITFQAFFDGQALLPEEPVNLKPHERYVVTIELVGETAAEKELPEHPLTLIGKFATDMGVDDLSSRHNWYAHGSLEDNGDGIEP